MKKSYGINLRLGTPIIGKWQKNKYTIVRKLGSGMIGSVYLCHSNGKYVALKISRQSLSMTKEVNVLQSINKAQDKFLGPYLFDVDDWVISKHESYSFYVMEYIRGESFTTFMRRQGSEWVSIVLIQLLNQLHHLHNIGWVFGDLKAENLIVEHESKNVRFIDVGGTTKIGRSIKEYTEFYDRGYWELGSRRAEPSYDLFAIVMVLLTIYYPSHFKKSVYPLKLIDDRINQINDLKCVQQPLKNAIRGKYNSAAEMRKDVMHSLMKYKKREQDKKSKGWLEPILILLIGNIFLIGSLLIF